MPKARSAVKKSFLRAKKRRSGDFSAQGKKGNSTARKTFTRRKDTPLGDLSGQKPGAISPHSKKIFAGEEGDAVIYGRAQGYRGIFDQMLKADENFGQRVTALRTEFLEAVGKRRGAGLSDSGWTKAQKKVRVAKAIRGNPASNNYFSAELATDLNFADTFLEAISDPDFPERPSARARFLAESIAGYGEVSARRCRDICSDMRKKEKLRKISQPELWIKCCGKARWTVNSVCPECGGSPTPITALL